MIRDKVRVKEITLRNVQGDVEASGESSAATRCQTMHIGPCMQSRICTYACIYSDRRIGGEVFELCGCSRVPLDRRASSVKWQSGMKGVDGHCTGGKKGWRKAEGGDCRRKDGRALQKGSLGSEGEKGRWEGGGGERRGEE